MCGIAGFLKSGALGPEAGVDLQRMAFALAHRGPDDQGSWHDAARGIALCHRRLSVVDLSPLGHQPMTSASGRYVITFNGEIYNYQELRTQLVAHGHQFRGSSDTEVLLAALDQWSLNETLRRATGMFAFAVWDAKDCVLHLARDRFGEKPLYYALIGDWLLFGSELKALRAHSCWSSAIDRDALALLLRHGYIPAPHTVFRDARKVRPGAVVSVRAVSGRVEIKERTYWTPSAVVASNARPHTELVEEVHEALRAAIRRQMVADVPVGAFLSGGIDSSLVVSMMQRESSQPVRTFAIGFAEQAFNEAPFARRVAEHLGTQHTELEVSPRDALEVIPRLPVIYDEPFADSSQIPTFLVSQLARRDVTVSLSGDGGDELFGGYAAYQAVHSRWQRIRRVPAPLRRVLAGALVSTPLPALDLALKPFAAIGRRRGHVLPDYLHHRAPAAGAPTLPHYYRAFMSLWNYPGEVVLGAIEPETVASDRQAWASCADEYAHMMHVDARQYLPDDILVKVDRA
ncbi:MAG TPA: asparagine synthase (glutamine-hydrolyzing), partial [Steroidobacteraceae bacterium]